MGICPAEGDQAYPVKLLVQVVSGQGAGADTIDIDPCAEQTASTAVVNLSTSSAPPVFSMARASA